jgi:Spy/CpxP family protein refolding chaperone
MMKHIILTVTALLFAFQMNLWAQPGDGHRRHKEMMQERKKEYIKEKLQLTEAEESKLMPLIDAEEAEMDALHEKGRALMQRFEEDNLNLSESEIERMNAEFAELFDEEARIKKKYHEKYSEILPPVKVFLLYKSNKDFKRMLIREFKGRGRHGCNVGSPIILPDGADACPAIDG